MPEYLFLNEQRGLYDAQSTQVEAWKAAHVEAMRCREIEDAIHLGLMILDNIRRHNERWAKDIEESQIAFTWDEAASFASLFRWWRERSELLLGTLKILEANGFAVNGSADFRKACLDVDLMSLDTDRVRASIESFQQGPRTSLTQAMNGLRNSLR
jgi:hypothetical protein